MNTEFIYTFICLSVFYQVKRTKVADLLHLSDLFVRTQCGWDSGVDE